MICCPNTLNSSCPNLHVSQFKEKGKQKMYKIMDSTNSLKVSLRMYDSSGFSSECPLLYSVSNPDLICWNPKVPIPNPDGMFNRDSSKFMCMYITVDLDITENLSWHPVSSMNWGVSGQLGILNVSMSVSYTVAVHFEQ